MNMEPLDGRARLESQPSQATLSRMVDVLSGDSNRQSQHEALVRLAG